MCPGSEPPTPDLGQINYEAYMTSLGSPSTLPAWTQLSTSEQRAWRDAANAVKTAVLG